VDLTVYQGSPDISDVCAVRYLLVGGGRGPRAFSIHGSTVEVDGGPNHGRMGRDRPPGQIRIPCGAELRGGAYCPGH